MGNIAIYHAIDNYLKDNIDSVQLEKLIKKNRFVHKASIDINTLCNLKCLHCSYRLPENNPKDDVNINYLYTCVDDLAKIGTKIIATAGKEPLMTPDKLVQLYSYIKERYPSIITGFVTNGTLINKNIIDKINKASFDYVNVSMEGLYECDDNIRKYKNNDNQSHFINATNALNLLKQTSNIKDIFVSTTITKRNCSNIRDMMDYLYTQHDIENFYLGTYMFTGFNPRSMIINTQDIKTLLSNIESFSGNVIIDLHVDSQIIWYNLIKENIVKNVFEDKFGVIASKCGKHHIINSLYSTNYWSCLLVSSKGYVFNDYSVRQNENYLNDKRILGNITNNSLIDIWTKSAELGFNKFLPKIKLLKKELSKQNTFYQS